MEDLDQARAAGGGVDRRRNHQQRCVVGRDHAAVGAGDRASRRNEQSRAAAEQSGDHRVVRGDSLGRCLNTSGLDARVNDRLDLPGLSDKPDNLGHRLHEPVDAIAKESEELAGRDIAVGHLLELRQEVADFPFGPLKLLGLVVGRHEFVAPSRFHPWTPAGDGVSPSPHRLAGEQSQAFVDCW